jgi:Tol biopolymer transport system component
MIPSSPTKYILAIFCLCLFSACLGPNTEDPKDKLFRISHYYGIFGARVIVAPDEIWLTGYQDNVQTLLKFEPKKRTLHPFFGNIPFVYDFAYHPGKDLLAVSVGNPNMLDTCRVLLLQRDDGKEIDLRYPKGQCFTPSISPDGDAVVFSCDEKDVFEGANLFLARFSWEKSEQQDLTKLTAGETFDAFPMWLPDGKHLIFFRATRFYNSSPIAAKQWHCWKPYRLDLETKEAVPLYDQSVYNLSWPLLSPDARWLAYGETTDGENDQFILINFNDNGHEIQSTDLIPASIEIPFHDEEFDGACPVFTPDSKQLIYYIERSNPKLYSDDRQRLCLLDLDTKHVWMSKPLPFKAINLTVSHNGESIYIFAEEKPNNRMGYTRIYKMSLKDGLWTGLWEKSNEITPKDR